MPALHGKQKDSSDNFIGGIMLVRLTTLSAIAVMMLNFTALSFAQNFPAKPFHVVTGSAAGGTDFASRLIGQAMTEETGQPVVVENFGGGLVARAGQTVAKALPRGYKLLLFRRT